MKKIILFPGIALMLFTALYGCSPQDAPGEFPVGAYIDIRDGYVYPTMKIGNQVWMTKNLAYLPSVNTTFVGSLWERYYVYDYDDTDVSIAKETTKYKVYGVLYNWEAALTACPTGWHLPTDAEWTILSDYLGGSNVAGGKMKEIGTKHWNSPNTGAINISFFTALPGGFLDIGFLSGSFYNLGYNALFWSSSKVNPLSLNAYCRYLSYDDAAIKRDDFLTTRALSVRCVRD